MTDDLRALVEHLRDCVDVKRIEASEHPDLTRRHYVDGQVHGLTYAANALEALLATSPVSPSEETPQPRRQDYPTAAAWTSAYGVWLRRYQPEPSPAIPSEDDLGIRVVRWARENDIHCTLGQLKDLVDSLTLRQPEPRPVSEPPLQEDVNG